MHHCLYLWALKGKLPRCDLQSFPLPLFPEVFKQNCDLLPVDSLLLCKFMCFSRLAPE